MGGGGFVRVGEKNPKLRVDLLKIREKKCFLKKINTSVNSFK